MPDESKVSEVGYLIALTGFDKNMDSNPVKSPGLQMNHQISGL